MTLSDMAVPIVVWWNLKDRPESLLDSRVYVDVVYALLIRLLISVVSLWPLMAALARSTVN